MSHLLLFVAKQCAGEATEHMGTPSKIWPLTKSLSLAETGKHEHINVRYAEEQLNYNTLVIHDIPEYYGELERIHVH